jgi:hypothetical protein
MSSPGSMGYDRIHHNAACQLSGTRVNRFTRWAQENAQIRGHDSRTYHSLQRIPLRGDGLPRVRHCIATGQTASKFPFHWWGVNPALSGRHQLNGPPGPHSVEEGDLDASDARDANPQGCANRGSRSNCRKMCGKAPGRCFSTAAKRRTPSPDRGSGHACHHRPLAPALWAA